MKLPTALSVAAVSAASVSIGTHAQQANGACSFCTADNQRFVGDPIVEFSSGNGSVSCGGLQDLINSGLSDEFCETERTTIEAACCGDPLPGGGTGVTPVAVPTRNPTESPTFNPTMSPTARATRPRRTASPTLATESPTASPTSSPSASPTAGPTSGPTASPTGSETGSPTASPTATPTSNPTIVLEKCVCYAPSIYDCPAKAPNRLRNEVMNDKRICTAGYGDECLYSGNTIGCGDDDDDVYLVDAVVFCEDGCTPLGATASSTTTGEEEEDSSVFPDPSDAAGSEPASKSESDSLERVSGAAPNGILAVWFGMVATAIIVTITV